MVVLQQLTRYLIDYFKLTAVELSLYRDSHFTEMVLLRVTNDGAVGSEFH